MNWDQKFQAMQSLCPWSGDAALHRRDHPTHPWYVSLGGVEVKDGGVLISAGSGGGAVPEAAIEATWKALVTDLKPAQYLVLNARSDKRRAVRWNGWMWADVHEARPAGEAVGE